MAGKRMDASHSQHDIDYRVSAFDEVSADVNRTAKDLIEGVGGWTRKGSI